MPLLTQATSVRWPLFKRWFEQIRCFFFGMMALFHQGAVGTQILIQVKRRVLPLNPFIVHETERLGKRAHHNNCGALASDWRC
jgi:hypothetical protein